MARPVVGVAPGSLAQLLPQRMLVVARLIASCEALNLSHCNPTRTLTATHVSMCPLKRRITCGLAMVTSVALIALLSCFLYPGRTYLQADTLIYVPLIERAQNPSLFARDIMVARPHMVLTIYDETAGFLTRTTGLDLETVLAAEQLVFRALGAAGVLLIALRLGFGLVPAWWIAATVSLGATIAGPTLLTVEYEPIPRAFAIGLIVLAIGLAAHQRYLWAGIAASLAFLFHATTTLPFWIAAAVLVARRRDAWKLPAPLVPALLALLALAHFQSPGAEWASLFSRLDPAREAILRARASYVFVSTWQPWQFLDYGIEAAIVVLAAWRVRQALPAPLSVFLWVMPAFGLVTIPLSWTLLEWQHRAYVPVWQPARSVLFVTLGLQMVASAAGVRAAMERRWLWAIAWLTLAFAVVVKHAVPGPPLHLAPLALALGLALVALAAASAPRKYRGAMLVLAGLVPFFANGESGLVENYQPLARASIDSLAAWARASTPQDSVFLFPTARKDVSPAAFRALARRALYVDWKGGGQVNYLPDFAVEWWNRWEETREGRWNVKAAELPRIAAMGVDYVVVSADRPIPGAEPAFKNQRFSAYPTRTGK